jgi:cobalt/nickel transport system permease protein
VFAYLTRADASRLAATHRDIPVTAGSPATPPGRALTPARVALGFVALMALLTPLGLLAPGGAFGEDTPADLNLGQLGLRTVPAGLARYNGFWSHTLLGNYGFKDGQHPGLAYILSATVGIAIVAVAIFAISTLIERFARRRDVAKPEAA